MHTLFFIWKIYEINFKSVVWDSYVAEKIISKNNCAFNAVKLIKKIMLTIVDKRNCGHGNHIILKIKIIIVLYKYYIMHFFFYKLDL